MRTDGKRAKTPADVPAEWRGDVFLVTDHGNLSLYVRDAWREIWSVV